MQKEENVVGDYKLWTIVCHSHDLVAKARQSELSGIGLSLLQVGILTVIQNIDGPATPAEISRWLFREPQTVTMSLKRMERQGLIRRVKDLPRKNMVRVELTEKGHAAYRQSKEKRKVILEIMSCLSQEEKANLRACHEKLAGEAIHRLAMAPRQRYSLSRLI